MTGVCAGVKESCSLGDVLVADPCWDWQMGKYQKEVFEAAPDQIQVPLEITQRMSLLRQDRKFLIDTVEKYEGERPSQIPNLLIGPVASGSAVLADISTLETVRGQHRKLLGIDMELYGVYSSVRDCCAPRPLAFGLKGVCDYADHVKNDKYQRYAAYMSAQILCSFVERYSSSLFSEAGTANHQRTA
jgi:nucleoside phosphorylase